MEIKSTQKQDLRYLAAISLGLVISSPRLAFTKEVLKVRRRSRRKKISIIIANVLKDFS